MEFLDQIRRALKEDRAREDVTSRFFLPSSARGEALVVSRGKGVVAGAHAAAAAFRLLDSRTRIRILIPDGESVRAGGTILRAAGRLASLLSAERTALNILSHLSGIATLTRAFVDRAGKAAILDTRKTLPGLRDAEKWAVTCGGGVNHRRDLSDAVLIKENHLDAWGKAFDAARFLAGVGRARAGGLTVMMEARDRREILLALGAGVDVLLLDNFSAPVLVKAVRWIHDLCRRQGLRRPLLEASGGVSLDTVAALARSGVDRISVGRITHSAPSLDVGLDVTVTRG